VSYFSCGGVSCCVLSKIENLNFLPARATHTICHASASINHGKGNAGIYATTMTIGDGVDEWTTASVVTRTVADSNPGHG